MNSAAKVALITGAGSGIGKHAALALLGEGYSLVLAGRRLARLEETLAAAGADGARALAVETDVGDPQSVAVLFGTVKERFGRLDLLFNNAGSGAPGVGLDTLPRRRDQIVNEIAKYRFREGGHGGCANVVLRAPCSGVGHGSM